MGHMDEELLRKREMLEEFERMRFSEETVGQENKQSIFDGEIMVNMVPVTFAERTFLDGRVSMWMSEDFTELSPQEIAVSYPLGSRPDKVYADSCLDLAAGYRHTQHEVPEEYMGDFPKTVGIALERMGPRVRILSEDVRRTRTHTISSMEMISHTITDAIYNILYFALLDGRVLMGFINFNYKNRERYKPIAREMLASLQFADETAQDAVQEPGQAGGKPL